jgi:predicted RNase H-like HicB family nuclease
MRKTREIIIIREDKDEGYFALSNKYKGAVGQGKTPIQALKDLEEAIKVLEEYRAKRGV